MKEHELLAKYTSWRIGGPARYYCEATNHEALHAALAWAQQRDLPVLLLGGGTNMLIRDAGFAGLVIRYRAQGWHLHDMGDYARLTVEAGTPVAGLARRISQQGWQGLAWAEGLPGTIGGAVYGNAGCYGGDIASMLESITILVNGALETWPVERLAYGYRHSSLKAHDAAQQTSDLLPRATTIAHSRPALREPPVILTATLRLQPGDVEALRATMASIAAQRKAKTPWGRTCGSVFQNPQNPGSSNGSGTVQAAQQHERLPSAGQLIDQAGLKGKRIGGAEISQRHANYIVNVGGATSDDVLRLIDVTYEAVLRQTGIALALEVQIV
jgi:UDP-N-acetylmuramate dehydrogenase